MKALAIRYRLRAPDRTLDATEIGTIREQMIGAATELGARLRGAE
jgi:phenylalanyl-tRNA synthetase beta subunit